METTRKKELVVFHPTPYLVASIDTLMGELAPDVAYRTIVVEDLLTSLEAGREAVSGRLRKVLDSVSSETSSQNLEKSGLNGSGMRHGRYFIAMVL